MAESTQKDQPPHEAAKQPSQTADQRDRARAKAEKQAQEHHAEAAKKLAKEYDEQVDAAPTDDEGDTSLSASQAGHAGTLEQWENSPAGKAFIDSRGGEAQATKS